MTAAPGRAAPLRFLVGVALCWSLVRIGVASGWPSQGSRLSGPTPAQGGAADVRPAAEAMPAVDSSPATPRAATKRLLVPPGMLDARLRRPSGTVFAHAAAASSSTIGPSRAAAASDLPDGPVAGTQPRVGARPSLPADPGSAAETPAHGSRLHGSAWAFLRGGGGAVAPLSPQGRIGGGQAGARILYSVDDAGRVAAAGRVSRSIDGPRQTEAAVGIDVVPIRSLPVHLTAERRIAIDRGGRDAWAAGVAGGVYALPVAPRVRLDGYGQAGVVGFRRGDLYVDGAVRVGREVGVGLRDVSLTLGGGLWGAAQPDASRLDVGPSAVLRVPLERATLAIAADYRARVSGGARPGSGPALTIGLDF